MKKEAINCGGNTLSSNDVSISYKNLKTESVLKISKKNKEFKKNLIGMNLAKKGQA